MEKHIFKLTFQFYSRIEISVSRFGNIMEHGRIHLIHLKRETFLFGCTVGRYQANNHSIMVWVIFYSTELVPLLLWNLNPFTYLKILGDQLHTFHIRSTSQKVSTTSDYHSFTNLHSFLSEYIIIYTIIIFPKQMYMRFIDLCTQFLTRSPLSKFPRQDK